MRECVEINSNINRVGKRVFVKSFGCSLSLAEAEFLRGRLLHSGFDLVGEAADADVLVYNTCAVKSPTENRVIDELREYSKCFTGRIIVAGCLPLINLKRLRQEVRFDGVLGPLEGRRIVEAVQNVLRGEKVTWLHSSSREPTPILEGPKKPVNPVISVVPVSFGCLGRCSYCCVVFARGRLRSCSIQGIVQRIEADMQSGAKEVWLTGQDVACYGRDLGVNLVDLLHGVGSIRGDFFVRVGMMTPNCVLDMLDELVEAFQNEHVFKFLHLPVQSGDDSVLRGMNRYYSVEDFWKVVKAFRDAIPEITIATDVICGFPGESAEAFERTLDLILNVKPDVVNMSKFFPRPGTLAEKMANNIQPSELKARSKRLAETVRKISSEKNNAWKNWTGRILVDERGKRPGSLIGRNFAYKPVVIKDQDEASLGKFVNIRVVRTLQTYLEATLA